MLERENEISIIELLMVTGSECGFDFRDGGNDPGSEQQSETTKHYRYFPGGADLSYESGIRAGRDNLETK